MDIKRTGPINSTWQSPEAASTGSSQQAAPSAETGSVPALPGMDEAFAGIQAKFKRADLHGDQWPAILKQSAEALVAKTAGKMGTLPAADQQKIAAQIAADPILSNRIFRYLDQHLA